MSQSEQKYDYDSINPQYRNLLTIEQKNVIYEMFSVGSESFRSDYPIDNRTKRDIWNNLVILMPKCNQRLLYRFLNTYDKMDVSVGDTLKIEHSLTTTKIGRGFMEKDKYFGKYIIICKSKKDTKAHDISVLWNSDYSILKGEQQVNFEEGTSFKIYKKIEVYGKPYIYMKEL